jgi:periplasmic copper chaperone A
MRLLTIAAIAFCMSTYAMANEYKVGSIEISNPWSRATPKRAQTAIGYMTVKNNGTTTDRLHIIGTLVFERAGKVSR